MRAVDVLYGVGDKDARDNAYAAAMAEIHERYPDDVEATALYALALLGTAHERRNIATYMRAAALLEEVFPTHPSHPGIAHYLIHANDDPTHAPLGMRAARAYSKIAPAAGHAQHMCSHIFLAMGMWDDLVVANETAIRVVDQQRASRQRPPLACGHYPSWLEYGYLQQGRLTAAKRLVAACRDLPRRSGTPADPEKLTIDSFVTMRARYVLDTEEFAGDVAGWSISLDRRHDADVLNAFVDGYAAFKTNRVVAPALTRLRDARAALDAQLEVDPPADGSAKSTRAWANVLEMELSALVGAGAGDKDGAIARLREAAAIEDSVPYEFGAPYVDKPTYELLGELLRAFGEPREARAAFEQALTRTPERTAALSGLQQAADRRVMPRSEHETMAIEIRSRESEEVKSVLSNPQRSRASFRWSPDSRALTYAAMDKGASGIWLLPIDGGQPRPLVKFDSEPIFNFAWFRTGDLALSRGTESSDVIMIRSFQGNDR